MEDFKQGEKVEVNNNIHEKWQPAIFVVKHDGLYFCEYVGHTLLGWPACRRPKQSAEEWHKEWMDMFNRNEKMYGKPNMSVYFNMYYKDRKKWESEQ
jgi:hypothetical protein